MAGDKADEKPAAMQTGRPAPDIRGSILWTQRIQREEAVNVRSQPGAFCVRAAVSVPDVPQKFKPGHLDPHSAECRSLKGFNPADHGWDPNGAETREFRRFVDAQRSGPRNRHPYPMTSYQEHGWLQAPCGDAGERVRKKRTRMGIGWHCKPPAEWSESTAAPPPLKRTSPEANALQEVAEPTDPARLPKARGASSASCLSACAPTELSCAAPSQLSRAEPSLVSATAPPTELSLGARSSSLPALRGAAEAWLRHREAKLSNAVAESERFLNKGEKGARWARPLGSTDATEFHNEFTKANMGVPLHKTVGSQEVVLKDPHLGVLVPKWR